MSCCSTASVSATFAAWAAVMASIRACNVAMAWVAVTVWFWTVRFDIVEACFWSPSMILPSSDFNCVLLVLM